MRRSWWLHAVIIIDFSKRYRRHGSEYFSSSGPWRLMLPANALVGYDHKVLSANENCLRLYFSKNSFDRHKKRTQCFVKTPYCSILDSLSLNQQNISRSRH
mmetsp:Transcript_15211/g.22360  ORF Transcript_15211/g.22360 Transcript_15211/m.22360 type:complete len:101 (-) Transcript_15211:23-325(-)